MIKFTKDVPYDQFDKGFPISSNLQRISLMTKFTKDFPCGQIWSVTERDRRDIFGCGPEVDQFVSSDQIYKGVPL